MSTKQADRRINTEAQLVPLAANRELTEEETKSLEAGKSRWLPRIFQSYGTPIPELMASPLKTGLMFGAPAALLGGGLGAALGGKQHGTLGGLLGALAAGGVAGTVAGMDRASKNEGLEELMRRLPENAAKRDLLADPQYQKDFLNWDDAQIVAQARARYYRPAERFDARGLGASIGRDVYNRRYKYSQDTSVLTGEVMPQKRAADDDAMSGYAGNQSMNFQKYSPQMSRRKFSPEEQAAIAEGESRLLPEIFQNYGTPVTNMLSSPMASGAMWAAPGALGGAFLGNMLSGGKGGAGSALGALGGAGLAGLLGYYHRQSQNSGIKDLMQRLPEGATKRDLLADPAYQADMDRQTQLRAARMRAAARFNKRGSDDTQTSNHTIVEGQIMQTNQKTAAELTDSIPLSALTAAGGALSGGLGGAGIGSIYGALTAKPGKRLRGALRGAGGGALVGGLGGGLAGFGAGATLGFDPRKLKDQSVFGGPEWAKAREAVSDPTRKAKMFGAMGLGALGGTGLGLAALDSGIETQDEEENKKAAQALLDNKDLSLADKMAAYKALLEKQSDQPGAMETLKHLVGYGDRRSTLYDEAAKRLGQGAAAVGSAANAVNDARIGAGNFIGENVLYPAAKGVSNAASAVNNSGAAETLRHLVGYGDRRSTLYDEAAKRLGQANEARIGAGNFIGENVLYPAAKGLYNAPGAVARGFDAAGRAIGENVLYPAAKGLYNAPGAIASLFKSAPPPPPPSMMQQIMNSPYTPYALGGLGIAGLGGLGYALGSGSKKKKRRDEDEGDEYMPKAASQINWYALKQQKQANVLRTLAALTAAGGAGAGIGAIRNYFTKKAPPPGLLEQIMNYKYTPHIAGAGLGAAALGAGAYMGSQDGKKKKPREKMSGLDFNMGNAGLGAGAGGALGALGGGVLGAMNPGHDYDEAGRKKKRSRLIAALKGALGGGLGGAAIGGLGGGLAGNILPAAAMDKVDAVKSRLAKDYNEVAPSMLRSESANANMAARDAAGEEPMAPTDNVHGNAAFDAAQNAPAPRVRVPTPTPPVGSGGATMAPPAWSGMK